MAYTFYKAKGYEIGNSLFDEKGFEKAKALLAEVSDKLLLPIDCVIADKFDAAAATQVVPANGIPAGWQGMDIGPATRKLFTQKLAGAKTVVWNGPMGVFEMPPFDEGTKAVALAVAQATDDGARSVIGGGDSASAIEKLNLIDRISHVSTGGGASLELLEGKKFKCIEILDDK
jgi:phosphoglycerate kinase